MSGPIVIIVFCSDVPDELELELPELDAMRYREWVRSLMGSHQTFFLAYSEGLESEAMWNYWKRTFSQLLSMPGFAAAWKELEPLSDEEFRAYITNENFR